MISILTLIIFTLILGIYLITRWVLNPVLVIFWRAVDFISRLINKERISRLAVPKFYSRIKRCEIDPQLVILQHEESKWSLLLRTYAIIQMELSWCLYTVIIAILKLIFIQEQRIDDSYILTIFIYLSSMLRYILTDFERNYQIRIRSKKINNNRFASLKRFYSNTTNINRELETPNTSQMNPWFITGFIDGEGCFRISLTKRDNAVGWRVQLFFQISLHKKDKTLLENIQNFFGVGKIHKSGLDLLQYRVQSLVEIETILNHFNKYPLISQKLTDYELFKKAFNFVQNKEHLTTEGLYKIINLKASLNLGLSEQLKIAFPDIVAVGRPEVSGKNIPDANWLAGFVSAEGCFFIGMGKSDKYVTGFQVYLVFIITQHIRDEGLMRDLIPYLGCGNLRRKREVFEYQVSKFPDLLEKIIPFFNKYPILGEKFKDFSDFCRVAELMRAQAHLSKEGLEKIRKIKEQMNSGRK